MKKSRRTRDRTFTGCWTCRTRKVKCDENKPGCSACLRLGVTCTGYDSKLIWVEDENQVPRSDGRRYIECESIWGSIPVLQSDVLDYLISKCDTESVGNALPIAMETSSIELTHNPFTSFRMNSFTDTNKLLPELSSPGSIECMSTDGDEKLLFHHYVQHVATIMMPFEHFRNPWKSSYPAVALHHSTPEQRALYSALLAHSAFNLAQLDTSKQKMLSLATKYYNLAIRQLAITIASERRQYADTLAVIMTLMMAETYSGHSKTWKKHLKGAWAFLCQASRLQPWLESDFACVSSQSLCIINIISQTTDLVYEKSFDQLESTKLEPDAISDCETFPTPIASTFDFGFTIGATKAIIQCISQITKLAHRLKQCTVPLSMDAQISEILSRLQDCERGLQNAENSRDLIVTQQGLECLIHENDVAYHQVKAFIFGTYIYLYRIIFDLPPCSLTSFITPTLEHVSAFMCTYGGNFSLWPAFIAAVEAYTDRDTLLAREWLEHAVSFGLGNRQLIRKVVEETWKRRKAISEELKIDQGLVSVDWREVMKDLDVDVLLI